MKELNHQSGETFEGSRNSDSGADFNQNAFGSVDKDLKSSGLVDWGVE